MTIEIREAGIERASELGKLFSDHLDEQISIAGFYERNPSFNPDDYVRGMMNPKLNVFLAAFDGDKIVGFMRFGITYGGGLTPLDDRIDRLEAAYLRRLPRAFLERLKMFVESLIDKLDGRSASLGMMQPKVVGYIGDLFIVPEYRNQGIGKALVAKTEDWYRENNILELELYYLGDNERGRAFWKSLGYTDRRILAGKRIAK